MPSRGRSALRLVALLGCLLAGVPAVILAAYAVAVPFHADGDYGVPVSVGTRVLLVALLVAGSGAFAYVAWGLGRHAAGRSTRWLRVGLAAVAAILALPASFAALLVTYSGG